MTLKQKGNRTFERVHPFARPLSQLGFQKSMLNNPGDADGRLTCLNAPPLTTKSIVISINITQPYCPFSHSIHPPPPHTYTTYLCLCGGNGLQKLYSVTFQYFNCKYKTQTLMIQFYYCLLLYQFSFWTHAI